MNKIGAFTPLEWHKKVIELARDICRHSTHLEDGPCAECIRDVQERLEKDTSLTIN